MTGFFRRLKRLWALSASPAAPPTEPEVKSVRPEIVSRAWQHLASWPAAAKVETFRLPEPMPGVLPKGVKLATDSAVQPIYQYAGTFASAGLTEGLGFPGYSYLAELTQRPEYRRPSEIIAKEMTRKWMRLVSTGDEDGGEDLVARTADLKARYREADPADVDLLNSIRQEWSGLIDEMDDAEKTGPKAEKIAKIKAELKRLNVQALFRDGTEQDGWYGRFQIWIETCEPDNRAELMTPLSLDAHKIGLGDIKSLRLVEAMWTYPGQYDSTNPLRPDFFNPSTWYVMGTEVHSSRLLTFVSRPLPDILKPAYQFGGLSLSQMLKPYVDNWLRTRQSVSDGISNFSIMILLTDLSQQLQQGGIESLITRVQAFNRLRDNNGIMLGDKNAEDLKNVSMPLGSLDHLQAQAQEHMSAVTGVPLVKAFGITPSGLNASSDGEIKCFYDWINALQEAVFTPNLSYLLNAIQLSLFGEIDPEIGFMWEPLWSLNELELATARKTEADIDAIYLEHSVLDPHEVRAKIANDEDSPYSSLDVDKEIAPPAQGGDDEDMAAISRLIGHQHDDDADPDTEQESAV